MLARQLLSKPVPTPRCSNSPRLPAASTSALSSASLSNVARGTTFENACMTSFSTFGLQLHRTGGRGDRGIDLAGWWHPRLTTSTSTSTPTPSPNPNSIRVHVQCKTLRDPVGPVHLRELEGMLARSHMGPEPLIGLFCSTSGYSTACKAQALNNTAQPILLATFSASPSPAPPATPTSCFPPQASNSKTAAATMDKVESRHHNARIRAQKPFYLQQVICNPALRRLALLRQLQLPTVAL